MKKSTVRILLLCLALLPSNANIHGENSQKIFSTIKQTPQAGTKSHLSDQDYKIVIENITAELAYIPEYVKTSIRKLHQKYRDLDTLVDIALFLDQDTHIAPYEALKQITSDFIDFLSASDLKETDPEDKTLNIMEHYAAALASGDTRINLTTLDEDQDIDQNPHHSRGYNLFNTNTGLAVTTGGQINIYGDGTSLSTQGSGDTVTVKLSSTGNVPIYFPTNTGTASSFNQRLSIFGGSNINTTTGLNSNTVSVNLNSSPSVTGTITAGNGLIATTGGLMVGGGGINSTGPTRLNSLGGGVMTTSPTGVVSSGATTNNAVQIGNALGTLTSIGLASNGQVLLGATGAAPAFGTLTSNAGTITFTPGPNSLNLEASGNIPSSFPTNAGTATPLTGVLNISGGSNINTSTGANSSTVTINLNSSPSVTGTVTADNGLIATTGGLIVGGGGINSTGTTILNSLGGGVMTASPTGVVSSSATTNNAVQIGNATGTLTSIGLASDGQVLLGATGAAPAFGTLTSNAGTITFTPGPNSLNLEASGTIPSSFPTNAGTATPLTGVLNISGGSNINTSTGANSSTVTINLNSSPSVTGTVTADNGLIATTGGLIVGGGGINSTGTTILNSLGGGVMTTSPTGVVSSSATTNNAVQIGNATGTLTSIGLASDGQVLLGATGAAPAFGTLTSNAGTITFTPGPNTLNLEASGNIPSSFPTNAGTATPLTGVLNISGGSNINTSTGANSSTVTINLNSSPSVTGTVTANNGLIATTGGLIVGGGGINAVGNVNITGSISATNTITAGNGLVATTGGLSVQGGGINSTGTTRLNSLTGGVMTTSPTGVVSSRATTNNAVQIGNTTGTLTSIGLASNGQVLLGATGAAPAFGTLTSNAGTITFTPGVNSLNLEASGNIQSSFPTNAGTATPLTGVLNISGGSNINTSTGANSSTVTINLNSSPSVTGTITAGNGLIATTGGLMVGGGGINSTGPTRLNSLTGGVMTTSPTGVVSSRATTNNAVQIGNVTGTLTSIRLGTNGQVLLGSSGAAPFFTGLSSPANASGAASIIYSSGASFLALQSVPLFVNILRVDWLNGDNATATVTNGRPYQTISAALTAAGAAASSVSPYVIWVMPGIYNETLTMQPFVSVIGTSEGAGSSSSPIAGVTIQQLSVGVATTLVTMADNSRLENVNLVLTSTTTVGHVGILFPSGNTSNATARVQDVNVSLTAGGAIGSNRGIEANNTTGNPGPEIVAVSDCTVVVTATGASNVTSYAFDIGAAASTAFNINNSTGKATGIAGGSGIALNLNSGVTCSISNSSLEGNTFDLQTGTSNTATLTNTRLVNSLAFNGVGSNSFTSTVSPAILVWATTGVLAGANTRYYYPGTTTFAASTITEGFTQIPMPQACVVKSLRVRAGTGPGGILNTVFTIRNNGVATALTATLTGAATTVSDLAHSVRFLAGDLLSLQVVTVAAHTTQNILVTVELY